MKKSLDELQRELETIIAWFESDDADIDQAEAQYQRGLEVSKELQDRLQETKNRITKLKTSFEEQ